MATDTPRWTADDTDYLFFNNQPVDVCQRVVYNDINTYQVIDDDLTSEQWDALVRAVRDADQLAAARTVTRMLDKGWRPYNGWWWWTLAGRPSGSHCRKITPDEAAWLKQARETET
jgi:hypothetical protein